MIMKVNRTKKGFTLIETIVASTILCGSVLTVTAICSQALSNTRLNRQYETALSLADRQLSLIDYVGIDEFIELGSFEGEFSEEQYGLPYIWDATYQTENLDNLYYITVTIRWADHGRDYSISVDTMLDGVSIYAETTEEAG
jgi:prepilin-type N-terminal cleavage/methylation domain-containing protein